MLKIVHIMLGRGLGGLENTFVAYARAISELGYQVHVVVDPKAAILPKLNDIESLSIHALTQYGQWDIFAKKQLEKILRTIEPNIIFALGNRAMCFLHALKKKYPIIPITSSYKLNQLVMFDYAIAMTESLRKTILFQQKISEENIFLLPNPVIFSENKRKKENELLTIGALGRFVEKKGFDTFLQSLSLLCKKGIVFKAILAGAGEEEKQLKKLSKALGLENILSFPGWMTPDSFFSQIDIFCLPSYHEPFGIVVVEALASQKVIVSTMSEGPSEILTHEKDALMVPVRDIKSLADALESVLKNQSLRKNLSTGAYETYQNTYTFEKIKMQLDDIILTITAKSRELPKK